MGTQVSTKGATEVMEKKASLPGILGKLIVHGGKLSDVVRRAEIWALYIFSDCFKMFCLLEVILNFLFSALWCVLTVTGPCMWTWHYLFLH